MFTISLGGYNARHSKPFLMSRPNGNNCYLLLLVKSPAQFKIKDRSFIVSSNCAILIDRKVPYEYESLDENYINDWLHFDVTKDYFLSVNPLPFHTPIFLGSPNQYSLYLQQILWEHNFTKGPYKNQNIDLLMQVLLNHLVIANKNNHERVYNPYYAKLQGVRLKISSEPYHSFTAEEFAKSLGISSSYFQALYKEVFQVPFQNDVIAIRIDYAKDLLLDTNLKLEQIAALSGYHNEVHFYRQFKKKIGLTPSEYRKKQL